MRCTGWRASQAHANAGNGDAFRQAVLALPAADLVHKVYKRAAMKGSDQVRVGRALDLPAENDSEKCVARLKHAPRIPEVPLSRLAVL